MDIFSQDEDREEYLNFLKEQGERFGVTFLAYCLMNNHVHLLAVPDHPDSLGRAVGEAHRLYTCMVNLRDNVRGYLFQGRFSSCPVAIDSYLLTALRFILRIPVKAGIVDYPWEYRWSSAGYHCGLVSHDPLLRAGDLSVEIDDWQKFLSSDGEMSSVLEEKNRTGRPFGSENFYKIVEDLTGCDARPGRPGRPKKES